MRRWKIWWSSGSKNGEIACLEERILGSLLFFVGGLADTASRDNVKHRAGTKRNGAVEPVRLLQLSAAGEVFLEGTCPLSRCPQTAKFPAPCFWRTGKGGEKSDRFSRAERTRPLRPVSRLLCLSLENVPAERFQRDFPLLKSADTARRVPTNRLNPPPSLSGEAKSTAQPFRQASCFDLRDFLSIPIDELGGIVL